MAAKAIVQQQEHHSIEIINRFGTALVSSRDLSELFGLVGEAVHALIPDALLVVSKLAPDGSHMTITWQRGIDRYLGVIKKLLGIDFLEREFSLMQATPEELTLYRNGKLHHFKDGLYNLLVRTIPKPVCRAVERALRLGGVHAIGFAWNGKHYGALVILLPKGKRLTRAGAIETIVHLGSVGIQRMQAEEAVRQSEENRGRIRKLEALGILAAGIAHDFNNLHMGIFSLIECAKAKVNNGAGAEDLEKACACMDRARALTSRLLTFSQGGAPALEGAPLFPFVEKVLKAATDGSAVTCRVEKAGDLRNCLYDKDQMGQVLHAMARNAVDAMPSGGELVLLAVNKKLAEVNRADLPAGDYLRLSLADHGTGISEKALPHVFDPFFSTKSRGSGLNLAIAHSVLKRHGGSIDVESTPGRGTTFYLYLKAEQ